MIIPWIHKSPMYIYNIDRYRYTHLPVSDGDEVCSEGGWGGWGILGVLFIFITLKDHNENFKSNQKCRLINHSKSETGTVVKKYLENIN